MNLTKVISTELNKAKERIVKILRYGKSDVQTADQIAPFGLDSNPVKDLIALYAPTSTKGETVIIGYVNKNSLAAIGESRLFSTDENGNLATSIHLKNDGTMEIGGNADNALRYQPLDDELQNFKTALQQELALIATGIGSAGGSYTPGTLTIDISGSKIEEIKTL